MVIHVTEFSVSVFVHCEKILMCMLDQLVIADLILVEKATLWLCRFDFKEWFVHPLNCAESLLLFWDTELHGTP